MERRVYERHHLSTSSACRVIVTMGKGSYPATILDLSLGGVGFAFSQSIDPGKLVIAMLTNPERAFSKLLCLRVVHCTEEEDGQFIVGCEFMNPLAEEELVAMLA